MRTLMGLTLLFLAGCDKEQPGDKPLVHDWQHGQTWHVATTYRVANVRTEEAPIDLDGTVRDFGEHWTDEVLWSYQVVEENVVPGKSDELYTFSERPDGSKVPLTVIRAWIDPGLNTDPDLLESDPVVYLVFRAKRNRLAGVVAFTNVDGDRVEQAWSSRELGKSWSALSQTMLTAAPTYLPPHGVTESDRELRLENGSFMNTSVVEPNVVDVVYDDELGGGTVSSRIDASKPWPAWTVTDNVEATLIEDVSAFRSAMRTTEPPEDYDYRAALASSVSIDAALRLDDGELADGGWEGFAPDGFQPWNGSWWPQKQSALVFGYKPSSGNTARRPTVSDRLRDTIDPIKKDMDDLSSEIRDMEDGPDKQAKRDEYGKKQKELVDELIAFYGDLRDDLDGGNLTVANGQLSHVDGWSYDLDELSPMDKFALQTYFHDDNPYSNPFYLSAWELLNHYSPKGGGWWGHCNGWSGAAILTDEPVEPITVDLNGESVEYTPADLKGLLSESHYSTRSRFYGKRYYEEGDDLTDLTPQAFHKLVSFYLRDQQVPMVFDTDAESEVWNFPAYGVELLIEETTEGSTARTNINTATAEELDRLPGIGPTYAGRIIDYRETYGPFQAAADIQKVRGIGSGTFNKIAEQISVQPVERTFGVLAEVYFATDGVDEDHVDDGPPDADGFTETWGYTLITDKDGRVLRGEWDEEIEHPDFAWVPYDNPMSASSGGSENPYLKYGLMVDVLGDLNRH